MASKGASSASVKRTMSSTASASPAAAAPRLTLLADPVRPSPLRALARATAAATSAAFSTNAPSAPFSTTAASVESSKGDGPRTLPPRGASAEALHAVLTPGARLHGFTVTSAAPYPALGLSIFTLTHDATGAQYTHIARPDADNAFCVAFRTLPRDDTGVAHILEHSVLCGSEKFPVRDPFFLLMNRSLNTFMNAMTRPEVTYYPFSTQNEQDFKNLFDVYTDAVFFPNLDAYDFKQEGHRLEFATSPAAAAAAAAAPAAETVAAVEETEPSTPAADGATLSFGTGGLASESKGVSSSKGSTGAASVAGAASALTEDDIAAILSDMGVNPAVLTPAEYTAARNRAIAAAAAAASGDGGGIYEAGESDTDGEIVEDVSVEGQKVFGGGLSDVALEAIQKAEAEAAAATAAAAVPKQAVSSTAAKTTAAASTTAEPVAPESSSPLTPDGGDVSTLPLVFKGIVFNEMKGALSDPGQLYDAALSKHLFPTSLYRNNSGGDPLAIPSLTHEQLKAFHRTHYSPQNASFFTYGDLPPALAEVDALLTRKAAALAAASAGAADVSTSVESVSVPSAESAKHALSERARFPAPRVAVATGPDSPLAVDPARQTKFTLSWLLRPQGEGVTDLSRPSLLAKGVDVSTLWRTHAHVPVALAGVEDAETVNSTFSTSPAVEGGASASATAPASVEAWEAAAEAATATAAAASATTTANDGAAESGDAAVARSSSSAAVVPLVPSFSTSAPAGASPTAAAAAAAFASVSAPATSSTTTTAAAAGTAAAVAAAAARAKLALLSASERKSRNEAMESIGLALLSSLLIDSPASPLYDILSDPSLGAGAAPGTGIELSTHERPFSVGLQGCAPEDVDVAAEKILAALAHIAETGAGLGRGNVLALLHSVEMGLKDATKNYGVRLVQQLVPGFVCGDDVQAAFAVLDHLDDIRVSVERYGGLYFQALLRWHILSNPHRLLFVMHPDANYAASLRAKEAAQLTAAAAALTPTQASALKDDAAELQRRQEQAPDPSCLPTLTVADIAPEATRYSLRDSLAGGNSAAFSLIPTMKSAAGGRAPPVPAAALARALRRPVTWHTQPTNGVVYLRAVVDAPMDRLTPRQLQLLPLLSALLSELGTAGRARKDHAQIVERFTGGVSISHAIDVADENAGDVSMRVVFTTKALADNADKAADLLMETVSRADFTDHLYNALVQYSSNLSNGLADAALRYARADAASRLEGRPAALLGHFLSGVPHAQSVTALANAVLNETSAIEAAKKLSKAAATSEDGVEADADAAAAAAVAAAAVPAGLSVSPTLARLANDLADLVRSLLLGRSHFSVDSATGSLVKPPTQAEMEASVEQQGGVDCAPVVSAPATSPKGGVSRVLITADEQSLSNPAVAAAAALLVDASFWAQPVAYSPLLTTLAAASAGGAEAGASAAAAGGSVTAAAWLKALVAMNGSGEYVKKGKTAAVAGDTTSTAAAATAAAASAAAAEAVAAVTVGASPLGAATATRNANGLKRRNYIALPVQVHSNVMAFKTVPMEHPDSAPLTLLAEVLTSRYLHREIREKGGAYGGFASHDRLGVFTMGSYRDPRSLGTVAVFEAACEWARAPDSFDDRHVAEAKLSLFSAIDAPETPGSAGLYPWLRGATWEQRQLYRSRLLGVSKAAMVRVASEYLHPHTAQVTVVGPKDDIPAEIDDSAMMEEGVWSITAVDTVAAGEGEAEGEEELDSDSD